MTLKQKFNFIVFQRIETNFFNVGLGGVQVLIESLVVQFQPLVFLPFLLELLLQIFHLLLQVGQPRPSLPALRVQLKIIIS